MILFLLTSLSFAQTVNYQNTFGPSVYFAPSTNSIMESFNRGVDPVHQAYQAQSQQRQREQDRIDELYRQIDQRSVRKEVPIALPIERSTSERIKDLKQIDLSQISDQELPYTLQSTGPFRDELLGLFHNLYKIHPQLQKAKEFKELGLLAVYEADDSFVTGDFLDADAFKSMAKECLNFAVGWDPVSSFTRSSYEWLTAKNMVTGKPLSSLDRGLAFAGIVSFGGEGVLQKLGGISARVYQRVTFVRIVPTSVVKEIVAGQSGLSREAHAFIGNVEEAMGKNAQELSQMFTLLEKDGKTMRDIKDHSLMIFKIKQMKEATIHGPLPPGYIPGGKTLGGAQEWVIPSDAYHQGLIDMSSIRIEDIL